MSEPRPAPAGTIHDLGYKRYAGTRRDEGTRWRVIARNQIAHGWKTWWRVKAWLGLSVIFTCVYGGLMLFASERKSSLGRAQGLVMQLIDTALPEAIIWFCRAGFVVSLTVVASVVAADVQSGAFTFYFARSVRPVHYVIGKLAGIAALLALVIAAGPLLLAGLRLGVSDNTDQLLAIWPLLPKTLAIGAIAVLVYTAVPLAFSALVPNRRHALALWAAYYLIFGAMAWAVSKQSSGWVAALDLPQAIRGVAWHLYELEFEPLDPKIPFGAALASLGIHVGVAIAIVLYRVRGARLAGVGGAS